MTKIPTKEDYKKARKRYLRLGRATKGSHQTAKIRSDYERSKRHYQRIGKATNFGRRA